MFALEIINALNDLDNPAKLKGLNAKLKGHRPTQGEKLCLGRGKLEDCQNCVETIARVSVAPCSSRGAQHFTLRLAGDSD